jgi:O-antigen ligase
MGVFHMTSSKNDLSFFESLLIYISVLIVPVLALPGITYEFATQKFAVFAFLFLLLFVGEGLRTLRKKKEISVYVSLPHIGFFVFALASVLSAFNLLRYNPYYFRYSLEIGLYVFYMFIISLYLSNRIAKKETITRILFLMLLSGVFVGINALINFYTGYDILLGKIGSPYSRATMKSTIGNPNFVSSYLGMLIPIALYFISSLDFGWELSKEKERSFFWKVLLTKIFATFSFILFLIVVLIAQTRSVYGSLIAAFLFLTIAYGSYKFLRKRKSEDFQKLLKIDEKFAKKIQNLNYNFIALIIILSAVFIVVFSTDNPLTGGGKISVAERVAQFRSNASWENRFLAWYSSIYQWKDYPVIGTGIGTYQVLTIEYLADVMKDKPEWIYAWNNFKRTHNDYLQVLGETGVIGLVGILLLIFGLLILYILMMKKQDDPDDALLLTLIAAGVLVVIGDSALSFPLHLMPNAMATIFFASIGAGKYFNKSNSLAWNINVKRTFMIVGFVVLIAIATFATWLKWESLFSEIMFKWGNTYYRQMLAYENVIRDGQYKLQQLNKMVEDLKKTEGRYSYLEQNTYVNTKLREALSKNPNLSNDQIEMLKLKFLKDREEEIQNIDRKLHEDIGKVKQAISEYTRIVDELYFKSRWFFLRSLKYNKTFGRSMFYLAILSTKDQRKLELLKRFENTKTDAEKLEILKQIFTSKDDFTKYIVDDYKDYPLKDLYILIEDIYKSGRKLDEIIKNFDIVNLLNIEITQDGIDYLETSFLCFNEKNSYRILGKLNVNMRSYFLSLKNKLTSLEKEYPEFSDRFKALESLATQKFVKAYEDFKYWYDKTIEILPGTWNRFSDWEKLYYEYLDLLVKLSVMNQETYLKMKEIIDKQIWVCSYMKDTSWGIPDDTFKFMSGIAQAFIDKKMYQEALTVMEDIVEIYRPAYEWNKELLPVWKEKANSKNASQKTKEIYSRMENFVKNYEEFSSKKDSFIQELIRVYENVVRLDDQNTRKIYEEDWSTNILTGENEQINLEEVIERLKKKISG